MRIVWSVFEQERLAKNPSVTHGMPPKIVQPTASHHDGRVATRFCRAFTIGGQYGLLLLPMRDHCASLPNSRAKPTVTSCWSVRLTAPVRPASIS
jgi:hypothetical protein